ncbi:MAG: glycosyltransferase family 4 protein [Myxococcales bacterium]|nr:glycosyltransferase family 4 protein [Myxococcales bacterium]
MRILTVTHYMPPHLGGIEMVADALVRGLAARGHDTRWVASAVPARPGWDGSRLRVPAWNALEARAGLPYPLWAARGLRDLDRQVTLADVVHVHDCLYMGSAAAVASARRLGKPVLLTQHIGMVPYGPVLDRVERLAYATLGRAVLAGADKLVACAPHVPAFFAELGVARPFELIRNGIDAERFVGASRERRAALRARYDLADRAWSSSPGRLVAKKGSTRWPPSSGPSRPTRRGRSSSWPAMAPWRTCSTAPRARAGWASCRPPRCRSSTRSPT